MIRHATSRGAIPSSLVVVACAIFFSLFAVAVGLTCDEAAVQAPPVFGHWTLRGALPAEALAPRTPSLAAPLQLGAKSV